MTLLSICQDIADETGYPRPSTIYSNSDETARKLLAAAKAAGRSVARGSKPMGTHDWRVLTIEETFTTDGTNDYLISTIAGSDFVRFVGDTMWDRTNSRKVRIISPVGWQTLKGSIEATAGIDRFVLWRGLNIYLHPTPASGETIAFEYLSSKWCQSSGGTAQTTWAADTDTGIIDEYLIGLEAKWRFLSMMGLPYAEEQMEAQREIMAAMSHDGIAESLTDHMPVAFPYGNVPDTGFGS